MSDPEDAIDEAYGAWLGGSGYADMQSYRDVFRDGWNAGSDHEARNCPQEGRIVALKAEIERLRQIAKSMADWLEDGGFGCRDTAPGHACIVTDMVREARAALAYEQP